jgi:hypothetical protein
MNWLRSTSLALPALSLGAAGADFDPEEYQFKQFTVRSTTPDSQSSYNWKTGETEFTGGVIVYTDDAYVSAEKITLVQNSLDELTGEVVAEGKVRIQRGDQIWVGDRIQYNFVTGYMAADNFKTGQPPYFVAGVNLDANTETGFYTGYGVTLTADDYENPAQSIRARSVGLSPDEYVEVYSATARVEDIPFFWLPYVRKRIDGDPNHFTLLPGYRSQYGFFALGGYNWSHRDWLDSTIHADYRTKRGFGTGIDLGYDARRAGTGEFNYYWANDQEPGLDSFMNPISSPRDRFKWYHQTEILPEFTGRAMVRYQSDEYIIRDFFEQEYRNNTQPNSYLELHKGWDNFSLNTYVQPQLNSFQETVERMPDIRFTAYRQQIGASPFFYESESSAGWYRREFANNQQPDYSAFRGDSWHQVVMPHMVGGWLNVIPRAGVRGTYYSEAKGAGATTSEETRGVFNTGVEMNFKASRTWKGVENGLFDVTGLRHIVQPGLNYVYIPRPTALPPELPQFDYESINIRPLPLDFPDYNSLDSINSQNTLRMGLYNKLQTKRDGKVANLLQWHFFTDWRMDNRADQENFGDLYSQLDLMPRDWFMLTSEIRYDLNSHEFLESNHYITLTPQSNWSASVGHRYMSDQPSYGADFGNNLLIGRLFYKLNENWAVSSYHYYDLESSYMPEQTYSVYRDLRSWTGALSFRWRKDLADRDDFTVAFVFSLKQLPKYSPGDDRLNSSLLFGN